MDVHRLQSIAKAEARQYMQEDNRIAPSRQADAKAFRWRRPRSDERRDPLRKTILGTVP